MPDSPFEKKSLDQVSFSVETGEFLGIIGHTGSGKSTLIQMFNGLLHPTSGTVYVNGCELHQSKESRKNARRSVGMVFQYPEYQLFEETVYRDIAFGPQNLGLSPEEVKRNVLEAAEIVELPEAVLEKSPFDLSGGQKRRAAIAGVLAMKPEILVLDEPVAGLDPKARTRVLEQINRLHQTTGLTVIMVSHSMEDVAKYAKRIVVMNEGRVAYHDTPREIFQHRKEIEQMGLSVPQVSKLVQQLKEKGFDVDPYAVTVEEAAKTILMCMEKKQ
ncbi:MAG: energy-coupling factor transporter ATPase [Ruminococcaceae bacterium]|nr:energy-coupling factor transporter ATPase [Oscillospiraceae bacterium]